MLERTPWQQEDAHRFLLRNSLLPLNLTDGDKLAFVEEVTWEFPEFADFADTEAYEELTRRKPDPDPLRAGMALCLWRVVERLAADRAFEELPLAGPGPRRSL